MSGWRIYLSGTRTVWKVAATGALLMSWQEAHSPKICCMQWKGKHLEICLCCPYCCVSIYSSPFTSPFIPPLFSDHRPQPLLMVESPQGEVMAGELLSIICKAPGNVTIRRFHFYRDGREVLPVAEGSEDNAADHGGSLRTSMVLQFPRAGPQHSGNFTCKYEEKKPERWIPSFTSQAVSISVNPPKKGELAIHPLT